ncbi:MAG: hypothetical protein CSB47_10460 [Proteobacteria bacterium]|nr:MAG: hypothetical protein CSB47_10460 [Pseudomonadota bacterium]
MDDNQLSINGTQRAIAQLTTPECDLADYSFMPLDVARLRDSKFSATVDPEAGFFAFQLWAASWHRVPAASLPDDDRQLCQLAGLGRDLTTWNRIKDAALYGFVKCEDGRWYHPVIAEKALECWLEKITQRIRSGKGNASKYNTVFSEEAELKQKHRDAWVKLKEINPQNKRVMKGYPYEIQKVSDKDCVETPCNLPKGVPQGSQVKVSKVKISKDINTPLTPQTDDLQENPETEKATPEGSACVIQETFDDFWKNSPLPKVGKEPAKKAWAKLCKKKPPEDIRKAKAGILKVLHRQADHVRDYESPFWKLHLSTYLNQMRWKDEGMPTRGKRLRQQAAQLNQTKQEVGNAVQSI